MQQRCCALVVCPGAVPWCCALVLCPDAHLKLRFARGQATAAVGLWLGQHDHVAAAAPTSTAVNQQKWLCSTHSTLGSTAPAHATGHVADGALENAAEVAAEAHLNSLRSVHMGVSERRKGAGRMCKLSTLTCMPGTHHLRTTLRRWTVTR